MEKAIQLVLIDNDELIRATWKITAEIKGHQIRCYPNLEEFLKNDISKEVPIYIDYHLNQTTGNDVAKKLHRLGYQKLYITTGSAQQDIEKIPQILKIKDKEYPGN